MVNWTYTLEPFLLWIFFLPSHLIKKLSVANAEGRDRVQGRATDRRLHQICLCVLIVTSNSTTKTRSNTVHATISIKRDRWSALQSAIQSFPKSGSKLDEAPRAPCEHSVPGSIERIWMMWPGKQQWDGRKLWSDAGVVGMDGVQKYVCEHGGQQLADMSTNWNWFIWFF